MVRNVNGGKNSKGFARKLTRTDTASNKSVRKPESEFEVFAVTTKMFGPMCEVFTNDGKTYKCHIRGKFKGRSKRNSIIAIGTILLVGFRDFEAPNFKTCDVLEVYDKEEVTRLQKIPGVDIRELLTKSMSFENHGSSSLSATSDGLFDFSNEIAEDPEPAIKPQSRPTEELVRIDEDEFIAFDDI